MGKVTKLVIGILAWLLLMVIFLPSCRTVDLAKTNTNTDSTAARKTSYDSSSYKLYEQLFAHYKEIAREYKPGRDTVIYVNGEAQVVQLPGQLVREIIREGGQQQTKAEESKQSSGTDSLLVELLKQQQTKDKDISSMPFWGWLLIGFMALLFLLGFFLIVLLMLRKKGTI